MYISLVSIVVDNPKLATSQIPVHTLVVYGPVSLDGGRDHDGGDSSPVVIECSSIRALITGHAAVDVSERAHLRRTDTRYRRVEGHSGPTVSTYVPSIMQLIGVHTRKLRLPRRKGRKMVKRCFTLSASRNPFSFPPFVTTWSSNT